MGINVRQAVLQLLKEDPRTRSDDSYLVEQVYYYLASQAGVPVRSIPITINTIRRFESAGVTIRNIIRERAYLQRKNPKLKDPGTSETRNALEEEFRKQYSRAEVPEMYNPTTDPNQTKLF